MGLEIYKGKKVEIFILRKNFRWTGSCLEVTGDFIILESDRDYRIISFRTSEIESIREVLS